MKALILGRNLENYYAKVHESFRNGLKALFDVRSFGEGYERYDSSIKDIDEIIAHVFGTTEIDYLFLYFDFFCVNKGHVAQLGFTEDITKLKCKKIAFLEDFWSEADTQREQYMNAIRGCGIDYVLTLFRAPFYLWKEYDICKKLIWRPVCFDPGTFNDWRLDKVYDVGNLNAGMFKDNRFYHERFMFHQKLMEMRDIKYYYAPHPGDGMCAKDAELIGKNFSMAINKCKIFVTSGNLQYRNFAPKYVEVMASGSMLMANEPLDAEMLGLIDGFNYVVIDENNIQDKVRYYLAHEEERLAIAKRGYALAMERYTCYACAANVYRQLVDKECDKV